MIAQGRRPVFTLLSWPVMVVLVQLHAGAISLPWLLLLSLPPVVLEGSDAVLAARNSAAAIWFATLAMLLLLSSAFSSCLGEINFPSYISSSMIFQRNAPFTISGTDAAHSSLTAAFNGHMYTATADASGAFAFTFPPQPAATTPASFALTSTSGAHASLDDVLFGDVFLSSGQSNMQSYVSWQYNYSDIIAAAPKYSSLIRIAQVAMLQEYCNTTQPQDNLTMSIPWTRATPDVLPGMSAIAYLTAVQLIIANPDVPIGAIASSWGGTAMEPWMPEEALKACGQYQDSGAPPTNTDPNFFRAVSAASMSGRGGSALDDFPDKGSVLWNSMIHPLTRLSIAGVYWYQGESNAGNPDSFMKCFPAMIGAWRQRFNGGGSDIPFIFFQLAPWPVNNLDFLPYFRLVQEKSVSNLSFVGMVVTADKGDAAAAFHPIHPPSKAELSRRAALVTQRIVYGDLSAPLQGPRVVKVMYDPWTSSWGDYHYGTGTGSYVCNPGSGFTCGGVRLVFDQPLVEASLYGDINSYQNGFVLWDSELKNFQQASITSIGDCGVTLQLNVTWVWGETPPAILKYAWADYPVMKLYNAHGMPAPPFVLSLSP